MPAGCTTNTYYRSGSSNTNNIVSAGNNIPAVAHTVVVGSNDYNSDSIDYLGGDNGRGDDSSQSALFAEMDLQRPASSLD